MTRFVVALAAALVLLQGPARAAEFERQFTIQADELTVVDLIGAIRVEGHSGSDFRVVVNVRGEDAAEKLIQIEEEGGRQARLLVKFPVQDHRRYVYPKLGPRSRSSFSVRPDHEGNDWLDALLDLATGDRIEVRGRGWGGALEVWADVLVQVPASKAAGVRLGIGEVEAANVRGDLDLRVKSGSVHSEATAGDLAIDTGSGSVEARRVEGDLSVDTGSGSVDVADVHGGREVTIDTGSGSVSVAGVKATDLKVDTGSGGVELADIEVENLAVETGSGHVEGDHIGADQVLVDTGSGSVRLDLVRMGRGRYDVDTGSGGIRLHLPRDLSAEFDVETGSGGIVADIDGVDLGRRRHRNQAHFTVGGGAARVTLQTGSGGVRLSQNGGTATRR